MASEKKDWGIDFINIEIKYPIETLMDDSEYPTPEQCFTWIGSKNRNFIKFSFGYNERSRSHTATATDSGSNAKDEKPRAITQHGKSPLSALMKLYFLVEICGLGEVKPEVIETHLGEREDVVSQQLVGLLRK